MTETVENAGEATSEASMAEATEQATNIENDGNQTETTDTQETSKAEETKESSTETPALNFDAVKLPEGVSVSDEDRAEFKKVAERVGINNQENLQNFVDWIIEASNNGRTELETKRSEREEAEKKDWEEVKSHWKTSLQGDAVFGKEYDANMKRAKDAIDRFGGSELTEWLEKADVSEHPAILKTFARIGKEIEDAKLLTGTTTTARKEQPRDAYNRPMIVYND